MEFIFILLFLYAGIAWVVRELSSEYKKRKTSSKGGILSKPISHSNRQVNTDRVKKVNNRLRNETFYPDVEPQYRDPYREYYNYIIVSSKRQEKLTNPFTGELGKAQSHGKQFAEKLGEVIDIYRQIGPNWEWVDKIYPSEKAIFQARDNRQYSQQFISSTTNIEKDYEPWLCPVCSAELEFITYDDLPVLEVCPNGHGIEDLHECNFPF